MPLRRRPFAWLAAAALLLVVAFGWWRCSPGAHGEMGLGTLVLKNYAAASWRISLAEIGGDAPILVRVLPLAEQQVQVPPGAYLISQTLLDIHGQTVDHRTVRWSAEAGQVYQWPLVSLQSPLRGEGTP